MTKKEELQKSITELDNLIRQNKEQNQLINKIDEVKNQLNNLEEKSSEVDEIKNHINDVIGHLPKDWTDKVISASAIITPLILIIKIIYDWYWDKIKTPQNLDDMLKQVKINLEKDKILEESKSKTKKDKIKQHNEI